MHEPFVSINRRGDLMIGSQTALEFWGTVDFGVERIIVPGWSWAAMFRGIDLVYQRRGEFGFTYWLVYFLMMLGKDASKR